MVTTNYIWDGESYLAETDETDAVTAVYTNVPDRYTNLVSQRRGAATSFAHYDALGSTKQLTDHMGAVTDEFEYDAWGNEIAHSGNTEMPFRYVGRHGYYRDEEIDTIYILARTYQPSLARWWNRDPVGFSGGVNRYLAMNNNPLERIDPSGLWPIMVPSCCPCVCGTPEITPRGWRVIDHSHYIFTPTLELCYLFEVLTKTFGRCSCKIKQYIKNKIEFRSDDTNGWIVPENGLHDGLDLEVPSQPGGGAAGDSSRKCRAAWESNPCTGQIWYWDCTGLRYKYVTPKTRAQLVAKKLCVRVSFTVTVKCVSEDGKTTTSTLSATSEKCLSAAGNKPDDPLPNPPELPDSPFPIPI